jgi:F-type H+-transporting ATPase subunit b
MENLILLAAETAEESGFGLNANILQTNLINLAIVIAILVYFGRNLLGKALSDRRAQIETAIKEAEQRKQTAAAALADEQQKLAQAQAEAAKIRAEAETRAVAVKEAILAQAQEDIQRLKAAAAQDLSSQQERIVSEIRQRIAALAVQQAEAQLKSSLNEESQHQLIDRSIGTIGGV